MSQDPNQFNYPSQPEIYQAGMVYEPAPTNNMGVAGFICSLVGIATCGVLSIVGVILSAIGLKKEPKGLAIAGLIIGLIGLVELVVAIMLFFAVANTVSTISNAAQQAITRQQAQIEAGKIADQWESNEALPEDEEGNKLIANSRDVWGKPFVYETDGQSFSIRSDGPDGIQNTEDDISVGPFNDAESAKKNPFQFNPELEELMKDADADWEVDMDNFPNGTEVDEAGDQR